MKSIKNIMLCAALLLFAGNFTGSAQSLSDAKKDVNKEQEKVKQDKDKAKEKIKREKDKMKEKKDQMKDEMKDAKKDAKAGGGAYSDMKDDKIALLEEKLKRASTDKERQEILKMIETAKKGVAKDDTGGSGSSGGDIASDNNTGNAQVSATSGGSTTSGGDVDDNDYDENEGKEDALKGKDLGMARADAAKAKLTKKEQDLAQKVDLVKRGRTRIAAAKERLAAAIAGGELTEDQIAKKQAMIDRAEAGIDKLEASINGGKAAYAKQKASLSNVYGEN